MSADTVSTECRVCQCSFQVKSRKGKRQGQLPWYCVECRRERKKAQNRMWSRLRVVDKDKRNAARRKLRRSRPEYERQKRRLEKLKYFYKITQETYDQMLVVQGGVCAICGSAEPKGNKISKHFQIDHDHNTGRVRGLLCCKCNRGIGLLGDSISNIERVLYYLKEADATQFTNPAPV